MIEYKSAEFFTEYFSNCEGFKLLEEFKESKDENEKNLYVGHVEVLDTIHPLTLRVEIPFNFPYNKLVFRTKSLSGYPHLIHNDKIEYGDWFCLNTPFAETPFEQLNHEVSRLKEWISHQMRNDLPAIIKDSNVQSALAFANAYEWENIDEVHEFSSQAMLTFVGNFHNDPNYFQNNVGYLSCIKSPDNRFYAISDPSLSNHKLPYIIVDQWPKSIDFFSDFLRLQEQYGWDEKICRHLLPNLFVESTWTSNPQMVKKSYDESEALKLIEFIEQELEKEEPYLPAISERCKYHDSILSTGLIKLTKVLASQKSILLKELNSRKETVLAKHKIGPFDDLPNYMRMTEEEREKQDEFEYYAFEIYPYEWHHFAFGIKTDNGIIWKILFTNRANGFYEKVRFDLSLFSVILEKPTTFQLNRLNVQFINEDLFFGRGSFCKNIKSKKIALVGLGAIGSMVASSIAHAGISKIGLWDFDIVEPGNICRSAYSIKDIGESKVNAIASIIKSINPFIKTNDINLHGIWIRYNANHNDYVDGSFYANVNYNNQESAIKDLDDYDLIIDCTGSNEMLHFLSYAAADKSIISMCITNHANDLLCVSNTDGNPFEIRKAYLSRIEQDTKNFYLEGEGCYSPTFIANKCDIAALLNLSLRDLNLNMKKGELMHSTIYSYSKMGIISDSISTYKLLGYDIILNISSETLYDAEEMEDSQEGDIGYILGAYSKDGKQIMITHIVNSLNAEEILSDVFETSKGIIDYIGDFRYSGEVAATYNDVTLDIIASKASDTSINTNNPLLAVRNPDGSITFFLYINNELVKFSR